MSQIDNVKYSYMADYRITPFGYYYTDEWGNHKFYTYENKPLFWCLELPWENPIRGYHWRKELSGIK